MLILSRDPDDWVSWLVHCQKPEHLMGWTLQLGETCGTTDLSLMEVGFRVATLCSSR